MKRFWLISFVILLNLFSQSSAEKVPVANELGSESSQNLSVITLGKELQKVSHPLPVDKAFNLSAILLDNNTLLVRWLVQPDYYLYKDKILFSFEDASIENINFPESVTKNDEFFGEVSVFNTPLEVKVDLNNSERDSVLVTIDHQGCWEGGVCYPPQTDRLEVDFEGSKKAPIPIQNMETNNEKIVSEKFQQGGLALFIAAFLAGLALSWTPCVYPMVPILSGIIIGQKEKPSDFNAVLMSITFVLSMSLAYGLIGASAGYFGSGINLQAMMQTPWVLFVFSLIFLLLALSMFGFYDLQLPVGLQTRLTSISNSQSGGSFVGVSIMGFLSALIVGPCVTPFLATALSYVIAGGSAAKGAASLFAMGLGMGVPLIIICGWGVNALPKAGPWMENVKKVFGFGMIAVALYLLDRVFSPLVSLILWALLFTIAPIMLGVFKNLNKSMSLLNLFFKLTSLLILIYGLMLWLLVAKGDGDIQQPFDTIIYGDKIDSTNSVVFKILEDEAQLNSLIAKTRSNNKILVIKFYAEWCRSCKKLERVVFKDSMVSESLKDSVTYTVDVTKNTQTNQSILSRFSLVGPPAILFFKDGKEIRSHRIIGEVGAKELTNHLNILK
ncbi:protein-disulfide reductase DsbD [Candidatus Thioglobus sp.]|nr:protein-disulfide reductase DsbD [Candidatus Thioglobus sp.]